MIKPAIVNTLFFVFGVAAFSILNEVDWESKKESLPLFFDSLGLLLAFFAAIIAAYGLSSWKTQSSHKRIYDLVAEMEDSLVKFLLKTANESRLQGQADLENLFETITICRMKLMHRGFDGDLL